MAKPLRGRIDNPMRLPLVLNKRQMPGRKLPEGAVYIGRPSAWGNPFKLGRDGDRIAVMEKYRAWLADRLGDPEFRRRLLGLAHASALVCWCKPLPCHGDLLVEALKAMTEEGEL